MSTNILYNHEIINTAHRHHDAADNKIFGFWIYLMSDCILFATLFATYAVLSNNLIGVPTYKEIFELYFVLVETLLLLFSSTAYGIAMLVMHSGNKNTVNVWLGLTFLFGLSFICMELYEFYHLIARGYGPDRNAFMSSFFTLVGTHGLHVISGLIWILVMICHIYLHGLTIVNKTRLQCLSLFWHILDVVWICVFTVVYLIGAL